MEPAAWRWCELRSVSLEPPRLTMQCVHSGMLGEEGVKRRDQTPEAGPPACEAGRGGEDDPVMDLTAARVVLSQDRKVGYVLGQHYALFPRGRR